MPSGDSPYFSREEAEALLPEIEALLRRAHDLLEELEHAQVWQQARAQANGYVHRNGSVPPEQSVPQGSRDRIREIVEQIAARGVILRDIRSGLIDFPALREGEEIFLCWKLDESLRIEWWHPTTTGIAGRQRL